jgi:flagellar hook-basal body complex protein FliE
MANAIPGLKIPDVAISPPPGAGGGAIGAKSDFFGALQGAMGQVEGLHQDAQSKVAGMLDGSGGDVHSAMIAVEKAGLAFEMMVQVRNKIVQAYQTVSQMSF